MNNTTEKNVLILGMSTFNQSLQLNHYYADSASGKHYRFDGVSQLEVGTKYYINYRGVIMAASYKKLFKLLIDRDMKKKELAEKAGISIATITKMGKDGAVVSSDILVKICSALDCTMDDIMEIVTSNDD